jgi:hypothetical protein
MPSLWWHGNRRPPLRYFIRDSRGKNVRSLLVHVPTKRIGSRYELESDGIYIYSSRDLDRHAQKHRRLDKMFAGIFPDPRPDVLNPRNSIAKLMMLRPRYMSKRKWIRDILAARYGWKGRELEEQTTAALTEYQHRPAYREKHRPEKQYLMEFNRRRWQEKARWELENEPLPLGYRTN